MRKKMLSWILTLTMVLSLFTALPITANAQTGVCEIIDTDGVTFVKDCDTLDEALTDVANGQTLRLLTDVPYAETLYAIGKSFSIDVNGFNLTVNPVNKNCVLVGDTQDLNIYDSRTGGSLTVTASGGDNLAGLYATGTDSAISIAVPSTITVNSDNGIGVRADDLDRIDLTSATTITATGSQSRGVYTTYGGSVNILNAIITADTYCVEAYGKKDDTPSSITVVGNVTASGMYANGAYVWGGADISITGDVSATNSGYGVWVEDGNAAITGDVTAGIYAAYATGGNSTITITGDVAATDADGAGADANNGGTITVNGNASGGRYGAFALYGGTILVTGDATAAGGLSPEYSAAVIADGDGSSVSVGGNATLTGSNGYGVQANNGGIVTVGGNVSATRSGCYGAYAIGYDYGGEITIEGSIDATTYISVGGDTKEPGENNELTTKEGYLTYAYGDPVSTVWVRNYLIAVEDTWIGEYYQDWVCGAWHTIEIGTTVTDETRSYALLRFDVSSLPSSAESVKLQLRFSGITSAGCHLSEVTVHRVTSTWDEDTVSYSTRPTWDSAVIDTFDGTILGTGYIGDVWEWDITELYNEWKANPSSNFGVLLSAPTALVDLQAQQGFYSKEGAPDDAYAPRLVIEEGSAPALDAFCWVVYDQGVAPVATGPAKLGIPGGPLTSITPAANSFWMTGADFVDDQLYGVDYNSSNNSGLYTIDAQTGEYELVGNAGANLTGFAYDAQSQVAYGIGQVNMYNYLYTVDLETGVSTPMGIVDGPYLIVDIAVDNAGNLYGLDINNDVLLSINPSTAVGTQIGSLGLDINYAQDLAYDRDNGILYGTLYANSSTAGLYSINASTGAATLEYAFSAQVDGFAIPYTVSDDNCIVPGCTTSIPGGGFTEFTMIEGEKYYHISNAAQLAHINEHLGLNYIQTADIDLSGYNRGLWNPIGGYLGSDWFTGHYLGEGHKIENMKIDVTSPDGSIIYAGLFGLTSPTAHIEEINLEIDSLSAAQAPLAYGEVYLGGIAATHRSTGTIKGCHVTINGNITATSDGGNVYVGGIVGYNIGNISGCSTSTSTASILTVAARGKEAFVGGIAGYTSGNILNSDNLGKLHAEAAGDTYTRRVYVGGITGYAEESAVDTIIENCQNDADIESINNCAVENTYRAYAGGIVGHIDWNDSAQSVIIRNCANIGTDKRVYTKAPSTLTGGIAASARFVPQTNITIENCYNRSNVISVMLDFGYNKGPEYCTGVTAGGIVGAAGGMRLQYCYSDAADISATATAGEDAYEGGVAGLIWGTRLAQSYYETNENVPVGIDGAVDSSMAIVPQADITEQVEGASASQLKTKSFYGDNWQWYTSGGIAPDYYSSTDPWRFTSATGYPVLRGLLYTPTPPSGGGSYTPSTYKITATANAGGTITPAGNSSVTEYSNITFTIKPDKNYIIKDVLVDGTSVGAAATYTFSSVRANHTIEAKFSHDCPSKPFIDVDITQWYHEGIDYVLLAGLFNGTSATTFEPNNAMTRAMLVTVLHRLEGTPATTAGNPFADVASGNWYTNAVIWANAKGIVKGYDSDTFGANDFITREQLVTILYRYAQYKGYDVSVGEDTNILSYVDALNISEYAIPAIQWACGAGVMQGDGAKLDPQGSATRAQVAAMLMRFIENVAK